MTQHITKNFILTLNFKHPGWQKTKISYFQSSLVFLFTKMLNENMTDIKYQTKLNCETKNMIIEKIRGFK